jgi:hypothetical protein
LPASAEAGFVGKGYVSHTAQIIPVCLPYSLTIRWQNGVYRTAAFGRDFIACTTPFLVHAGQRRKGPRRQTFSAAIGPQGPAGAVMVCGSLRQAVTLSDTMMVNRYVKWQLVNKKFRSPKESGQEWKLHPNFHTVKCRLVPPCPSNTCTWRCCPFSLALEVTHQRRKAPVLVEAYSSIFPCAVIYQTHPSCTRSDPFGTPNSSP